MTKKTCPLGEDCDLTIAWMAGRESAKDEYKAMIEAALEEAARMLVDLKPCPFCGSTEIGHNVGPSGKTLRMVCMQCDAGGPYGEGDPESEGVWVQAVNEWNTRAAAMVAAALEEAADALMECAVWCDSQERIDDGWRNGVSDARKHISRHIRARAAKLKENQ